MANSSPDRAVPDRAAADTRPLDVLIVTDGKPGHATLAEAIVAALDRLRPVDVRRVRVRRPRWLPPGLLSAITAAARPRHEPLVARLVGLDLGAVKPPHVVVSAGGDTLAANVVLARRFGCANVFYGSLRRYRPDDFTLVLTSYAAHATRPNVVMTAKPSPTDPSTVPVPPRAADARRTVVVLVGGDSGTVRYTGADWDRLLALLADLAAAGHALTVANARRTPPQVGDRLARLAAAGVLGFLDVRTAGPGTLAPVLARADAVLVTVDSSSMVSEAVWARRPVVVLAPVRATLPASERAYRAWLAAHGWTATVPLAEATPAAVTAALDRVAPTTSNPQVDLAALLSRHLASALAA
jgi:hypothetical protein